MAMGEQSPFFLISKRREWNDGGWRRDGVLGIMRTKMLKGETEIGNWRPNHCPSKDLRKAISLLSCLLYEMGVIMEQRGGQVSDSLACKKT